MKFTIENFSQEEALRIGLDVIDLVMLRWILDFYNTGAMELRYFDDKPFFWIRYETVLDDMPILGITNNTSLGRRFKRMVKSGLLEFKIFQTKHGSRTFYRFNGECLAGLIRKKEKPLDSKVKQDLTQKSSGPCSKSQALNVYPNTRDPNTKDTNTSVLLKDSIKKINKKEERWQERGEAIDNLVKETICTLRKR